MSVRMTKAQVQAMGLGVVVSWLRQESHLDGVHENDLHIKWVQEAQDRLALFVELEIAKLLSKK